MRPFKPELIPNPPGLPAFPQTELPIDIEIGCGVGLHPIQYAGKNPKRFLIALEHTREKFEKFWRRYESHEQPQNLMPIHANAISWVTHYVPDAVVEQYFLLYPNPHPKPKQRNQRWHAMPFMEKLLQTLKADGKIILATNEEFYAQEAKEFFVEQWKLKLIEEEYVPQEVQRTHFEKKYLARGESCFNLIFQRSLD